MAMRTGTRQTGGSRGTARESVKPPTTKSGRIAWSMRDLAHPRQTLLDIRRGFLPVVPRKQKARSNGALSDDAALRSIRSTVAELSGGLAGFPGLAGEGCIVDQFIGNLGLPVADGGFGAGDVGLVHLAAKGVTAAD